MFGFSFFKKDKKSSIKKQSQRTSLIDKGSSNDGSSGVDKYLQKKIVTDNKSTRVSEYIEEKENLNSDNERNLTVSGVAKYLEIKADEFPVSSVSKYVAKKNIHEKQIAKENVSGVEKYLKIRN